VPAQIRAVAKPQHVPRLRRAQSETVAECFSHHRRATWLRPVNSQAPGIGLPDDPNIHTHVQAVRHVSVRTRLRRARDRPNQRADDAGLDPALYESRKQEEAGRGSIISCNTHLEHDRKAPANLLIYLLDSIGHKTQHQE
jgi:hypothetical protein